MITKINKKVEPKFNVNDKVVFYTETNERGMTTGYKTVHAIVEKINKVTVVVRTKYDDKYKLSLDRIIKYEDPFANWNY